PCGHSDTPLPPFNAVEMGAFSGERALHCQSNGRALERPSDICPCALHTPIGEIKTFHHSPAIAFNCRVCKSMEGEGGLSGREIDQANDPQAAMARDGAACRQHHL